MAAATAVYCFALLQYRRTTADDGGGVCRAGDGGGRGVNAAANAYGVSITDNRLVRPAW